MKSTQFLTRKLAVYSQKQSYTGTEISMGRYAQASALTKISMATRRAKLISISISVDELISRWLSLKRLACIDFWIISLAVEVTRHGIWPKQLYTRIMKACAAA